MTDCFLTQFRPQPMEWITCEEANCGAGGCGWGTHKKLPIRKVKLQTNFEKQTHYTPEIIAQLRARCSHPK